MRFRSRAVAVVAVIGLTAGTGVARGDVEPTDETDRRTRWISRTYDGSPPNDISQTAAISADGRYAVFASMASNIVEDDTQHAIPDAFLRDMTTGETLMLSRHPSGQAVGGSGPEISADGRFVAFSTGSNLVPEDTNGRSDIYIYRVATGRFVLATTDHEGGPTDGNSESAGISPDGRFISYDSDATDLVASGDVNGFTDIFVTNWRTGRTELASRTPTGESPTRESNDSSLSGNGRFVSFHSYSWQLVPGDANEDLDAFVYDRRTDEVMRASSTPDGDAGNGASASGAVSADGRFVVYTSSATDLVPGDTNGLADVFRTSIRSGRTVLVTLDPDGGPIDGPSIYPSVSETGRYVTFVSTADDHLPELEIDGFTIFVRDLQEDTTSLVSQYPDGTPADNTSIDPNFGGGYITFSTQDQLAGGDTNSFWDVYAYRLY